MTEPGKTTIGDVWRWFTTELANRFGKQEAHAMSTEVFFRFLGLTPDQRVIRTGETLTGHSLTMMQHALGLLKQGMPVQYVTGVTTFLDCELDVGSGVLIPRPETEELVLWASSVLNKRDGASGMKILDVGTGSGCIAIALAKQLNHAKLYACDVSETALGIARRNAFKNKRYIQFFLCDVLEDHRHMFSMDQPSSNHAFHDVQPAFNEQNQPFSDSKSKDEVYQFDCIISNPPYVRLSEVRLMKPNVIAHEPALALFVDDHDPFKYYRAIANKAYRWLRPDGLIFFEINEAFGIEIVKLIEEIGFVDVTSKQDIHGKDRFVMGRK